MLVAGIGTEIIVSGYVSRICRILYDHVEVEIIEGAQIGRIIELSFEQVERAAGLS